MLLCGTQLAQPAEKNAAVLMVRIA